MSSNYDPEIYDLMHTASVMGDVEFYVAEAQRAGGPVLELGAGTGRIALALAAAGVPVTAVELDRGMLARLERKRAEAPEAARVRLTCAHGDMRDFALPERFARIFIPFRAFAHNLQRSEQQACLHCVHEHLSPGGKLCFNVFHPSLEIMAQHGGALRGVWRLGEERELSDGGRLVHHEANRYDTARQLVHSRHRFERYDSSGLLVETRMQFLQLAYFYPSQLRELCAEAGFTDVQVHGGFDRKPFDDDRDELVVEATRAG